MQIVIAVAPGAPAGERWSTAFYPNCPNNRYLAWADPDRVVLDGFASFFDAWAFAVAHCMIDPFTGSEDWLRRSTLRPAAQAVEQLSLF